MSKFKVGDRIRVLGTDCTCRGKNCVVTSVEDNGEIGYKAANGIVTGKLAHSFSYLPALLLYLYSINSSSLAWRLCSFTNSGCSARSLRATLVQCSGLPISLKHCC